MSGPLLEIRNVTKTFGSNAGRRPALLALRDINLSVPDEGRIVAVVGESGSGKTTLANIILGFVQPDSGEVRFEDRTVDWRSRRALLDYRRRVQVVFQDPFAAFNPFYRVRHVFDLAIRNFGGFANRAAAAAAIERSLYVVGLRGDDILEKFPHQLSGGQRQRIMFARAHLLRPRIIVADEPVSMVDASLRSSILDVMLRLKDEGISFVYITHDLGTVYQVADEMHVLYRGHLLERGGAVAAIEAPRHPYLQRLVESVPPLHRSELWRSFDADAAKDGDALDAYCVYYGRCPHRMPACIDVFPELREVGAPGHVAACHLYPTATNPKTRDHERANQ